MPLLSNFIVFKIVLKKINSICNSFIFQGLIILYLCVVIVMVRRQLRQVTLDEDDEEDKVTMINKEGKTDLCKVETVLNNTNEVMM